MEIRKVKASGGFRSRDDEANLYFEFDYSIPKTETENEQAHRRWAECIVENRFHDGEPGRYRMSWQFYNPGHYSDKFWSLGVTRTNILVDGPKMDDPEEMRATAKLIGDEYLKVLGQIPELLRQARAWAEAEGFELRIYPRYDATFEVSVKGADGYRKVSFNPRSEPLTFAPAPEVTLDLHEQFAEIKAYQERDKLRRAEAHEKDEAYAKRKREDAAKIAQLTRKQTLAWQALKDKAGVKEAAKE